MQNILQARQSDWKFCPLLGWAFYIFNNYSNGIQIGIEYSW